MEDYNPKQEMGSEKDLYSEVLSLDNASEMNNELEEDDKSNDYEMDRYNPESEGLNGQDEYSSNNESLENLNPIVVERSEKALLVTQALIWDFCEIMLQLGHIYLRDTLVYNIIIGYRSKVVHN